jgi:hypothetical protein
VSYRLLLIIHSAATAFLTYGVVKSVLFDDIRKPVLDYLGADKPDQPVINFFKAKAWDLIQCPYCTGAWVAGGVLGAHRIFVGPVPMPLWWWMATWAGCLVIYTIIVDD